MKEANNERYAWCWMGPLDMAWAELRPSKKQRGFRTYQQAMNAFTKYLLKRPAKARLLGYHEVTLDRYENDDYCERGYAGKIVLDFRQTTSRTWNESINMRQGPL